MNGATPKNAVHDVLRLAFRKKVLFQVGVSVFAIAAFVASHFIPLKYTGKAIFEFGLEAAAQEVSRASKESFGTIKERLPHDLAGYHAVEEAVKDLRLTEGLPHDSQGRLSYEGKAILQAMVHRFMDDITVVWEARSKQEDLVSVSFTHADPKLAEKVPNVLVKGYIDRTYGRIRSGLKRQHDFLCTKAEDADTRLKKAVGEKIDFETRHAGMLPENPNAFWEKIERAHAELEAARRRQEMSRLRLASLQALQEQATTAPSEHASCVVKQANPEFTRLKVRLRDLQEELDNAITLQHMKEAHPTVRALRHKIAQSQQRLGGTPREIVKETVFATGADLLNVSMATAAARSELETARNDIKRLEILMAGYDEAWANFAPVRQDYLALLKKVEDCREESQHWRSRLERVQIALAAAMDNRLTRIKAIQPAQQQFLPSSPSLMAVLALAVAGGLAFGAGLVFLGKTLDRTVSSTEEASEYFDLPIHGVIGEIVTPAQRVKRGLKKWVAAPLICLLLLAALALSATSAVFRLRYPKQYQGFWNSPSGFVRAQVYPAVQNVLDGIRG